MGRLLGAHESDDDLDRPDLNKCPECGCFFAQDACPLCGKVCPEEMRAGNRKQVKQKKRRRSGGSGRVTFVQWYHSWWFIILMLFVSPLIGIILLATSPHRRSLKIGLIAAALAYTVLFTYGLGYEIYDRIMGALEKPVDTSLDREDYIAACAKVDPKDFYRSPDDYGGKKITMTLIVERGMTDYDTVASGKSYPHYYLCRSARGDDFTLLIRDCVQDRTVNLIAGDVITVYGEGGGTVSIFDSIQGSFQDGVCLNVAYLTIEEAPAET